MVRRWNKFIILYWFVLLKLKWKVIYYFEQKSTDFDIKNSSKITILGFRPIGWIAIFMIYKLFQKCKRCVFALYIFIFWIPKFFLKLWLAKKFAAIEARTRLNLSKITVGTLGATKKMCTLFLNRENGAKSYFQKECTSFS